MARRINLSS